MARLKALNPDEATGKTKELFSAIHDKFGVVPNMMRTMGNSPVLLEGYLNLSGSLGSGSINGKTGKLISMAVAESNACDYCLSVHTYLGVNALKIDEETLEAARKGNSKDHKTEVILKFAKTLVSKKGLVNDVDVELVKQAGLTEAEISEVVGHVALNILTNYFNNTALTEIDFPLVKANNYAILK